MAKAQFNLAELGVGHGQGRGLRLDRFARRDQPVYQRGEIVRAGTGRHSRDDQRSRSLKCGSIWGAGHRDRLQQLGNNRPAYRWLNLVERLDRRFNSARDSNFKPQQPGRAGHLWRRFGRQVWLTGLRSNWCGRRAPERRLRCSLRCGLRGRFGI